MEVTTAEEAVAHFIRSLSALRTDRRMTKKALATRMGVDPSYVSHVESGRYKPTATFAWRADDVLDGRGRLTGLFERYWQLRYGDVRPLPAPELGPPATELIVEREESEIAFDDQGFYQVAVSRVVANVGTRPLTRFPARIEADVYPGDPGRSASFYERNPVVMDQTGFWATFNGEPTDWTMVRDRPSDKEIDIRFAPGGAPQPVYPGELATVAYGYRVHWTQWGDWFARDVRWPTRSLALTLLFSPCLAVELAGYEITFAASRALTHTTTTGPRGCPTRYGWSTPTPALSGLYLFEWKLRLMSTIGGAARPEAGSIPAMMNLPLRDPAALPPTATVGVPV